MNNYYYNDIIMTIVCENNQAYSSNLVNIGYDIYENGYFNI